MSFTRYVGQLFFTVLLLVTLPGASFAQTASAKADLFRMSGQKRIASETVPGASIIVNDIQEWDPKETAIIISDMWDKHWCDGATDRVTEMAPRLNTVLAAARDKGMLIVHAPSDCMDFYEGHPARMLAKRYDSKKYKDLVNGKRLETEIGAPWPIDQSDEGCEETECKPHKAWTRQIETIQIHDIDAITDSGAEMAALFEQRGIKNVILAGVHTNMCIIERTYGLRSMIRLGQNAVLMRDMTDAMYNSKMPPYVDHFTGRDLIVNYIERYICPTMLSTDITGERQFRFAGDTRPVIAFITAEGEYHANQKLPEFAHHLMLNEGVACEFAVGKAAMDGPGRHNIENLRLLEFADLAVFFVRRVALEPEKMQYIRNYVAQGKPILGIRTASHAFDAKGNVPREGGGVGQSSETVSGFLEQWPEFDEMVFGGNYQGHYGRLDEPTRIDIVPGMGSHPILEGVPATGFDSPNWLYQNNPLRSEKTQVLLTGTIPDERPEPVLWINTPKTNNQVIYTSLGHWDDWQNPAFHRIMVNSVRFLLKKDN